MSANVVVVSPADIHAWMDAGLAVIVDVREPHEFAQVHIPGATLIPLSSFDPSKVPTVSAGQKLVFHCRSGVRCGQASQIMAASGWSGEINRMAGGIMAWEAAQYPVEKS